MPLVGQVHLGQHVLGLFQHVPLGEDTGKGVEFEGAIALGEDRDHHVFQHREVAEDLGRLEHPGNPHLADLVGRAPQHRLAVEEHRSGVGDQLADQAVEQGGLAGAIGADDGVAGVLLHAEIDVAQRLQSTEPLAHVFDFKNTHGSRSLFRGVALLGGLGLGAG